MLGPCTAWHAACFTVLFALAFIGVLECPVSVVAHRARSVVGDSTLGEPHRRKAPGSVVVSTGETFVGGHPKPAPEQAGSVSAALSSQNTNNAATEAGRDLRTALKGASDLSLAEEMLSAGGLQQSEAELRRLMDTALHRAEDNTNEARKNKQAHEHQLQELLERFRHEQTMKDIEDKKNIQHNQEKIATLQGELGDMKKEDLALHETEKAERQLEAETAKMGEEKIAKEKKKAKDAVEQAIINEKVKLLKKGLKFRQRQWKRKSVARQHF